VMSVVALVFVSGLCVQTMIAVMVVA
jgi:hypothetical protein